MSQSNPKISVIIPTYNRVQLLRQQLGALTRQTYSQGAYEVIVVNDGSTDGTEEFLDQLKLSNSHLTVIHQSNGGPAKARNTAIEQARGEIIAFTDDDCEVDPDWLEIIAQEMDDELLGLQGATYTDHDLITPLTHQIDNETGHNSVPTCNAAYRKDVLVSIGGFDESFPNPHNEDTDVSWRVQELGEIRFCPSMRVHHPPRLDKFSKVAKRMKIMDCEFTLFDKHPALYQKHRDRSPLKHIYGEIFFYTIGYYFLSRLKLWRKPKQMVQGLSLAVIWWADLAWRFPKYWRLSHR